MTRIYIRALCKTINNYLTHQPTNLLIKDALSYVYYIFVIKQIDVLQIFKLTQSISSIHSTHLLSKIDPPKKKIEFPNSQNYITTLVRTTEFTNLIIYYNNL